MTIEIIKQAVIYVSSAPFFWGSMGFTTALAMFAGVLLYDGNLTQIRKGLVSVLSYASMVFWLTSTRVIKTISTSLAYPTSTHPEYAYAGLVSVVLITLAWVLGLIIGVTIFRIKYKGLPVEKMEKMI